METGDMMIGYIIGKNHKFYFLENFKTIRIYVILNSDIVLANENVGRNT